MVYYPLYNKVGRFRLPHLCAWATEVYKVTSSLPWRGRWFACRADTFRKVSIFYVQMCIRDRGNSIAPIRLNNRPELVVARLSAGQ